MTGGAVALKLAGGYPFVATRSIRRDPSAKGSPSRDPKASNSPNPISASMSTSWRHV